MKRYWWFIALLLIGSATVGAAQSPNPSRVAVAVDTAVSRQLAGWWKVEDKPSKDIACLTGVVEGDSVVVITGAVLVPGNPQVGCVPGALGAVGFINGSDLPNGATSDDVLQAMCGVLAKQENWLIAGEVYGVMPVMYSDKYWGPGALVWACTRSPRDVKPPKGSNTE